MRSVVPARALARRSQNVMIGAGLLVVLGALAITMSIFMQNVPLVVAGNPNYDFYVFGQSAFMGLGGLLIVVALGLFVRALTWKQDNPLAVKTGEALGAMLDDRYVYIRNLSKLALGYMDAVLVGPAGVLVFRITNRAGVYFNEGAYWMTQKDKGAWQTLKWSPTKECIQDIEKLREFLRARGLADVPVFGVVVFTEDAPATHVTVEKPVVPVLQPQEFSYGLSTSYFAKTDRVDQLTANKIATHLLE